MANYRATYLLAIPDDLTILRSKFGVLLDSPTTEIVPEYPPDYQEPDDDMSRLKDMGPDVDVTDTYRPAREDDRDREPNRRTQDEMGSEADYYSNLDYERTQDPGFSWPDRYSWDQYDGGYYY